MRIFELRREDYPAPHATATVDLDKVVGFYQEPGYMVELVSGHFLALTKEAFDRMKRAWESK